MARLRTNDPEKYLRVMVRQDLFKLCDATNNKLSDEEIGDTFYAVIKSSESFAIPLSDDNKFV